MAERGPKEGVIRLRLNRSIERIYVNNELTRFPNLGNSKNGVGEQEYKITFPASFLFVAKGKKRTNEGSYLGEGNERGHYVLKHSGLNRGGGFNPYLGKFSSVPLEKRKMSVLHFENTTESEVVVDYLTEIPTKDTVLKVYVKNYQDNHGNSTIARLYLNGKLHHEYDFALENPQWKKGMPTRKKFFWNTDLHRWLIPLGHLVGKEVLITLATDNKNSVNADDTWWYRPMLINMPRQEESFSRYNGKKYEKVAHYPTSAKRILSGVKK